MVRVDVAGGLSGETSEDAGPEKNDKLLKKPSVRIAKPKKPLNFGAKNMAIYPLCGDERFLQDDFSLPKQEKELFIQVISIIQRDYPGLRICFITTDELEVHNNFTLDNAKKMGDRARDAYRSILLEADMIKEESFIFESWSTYREKAEHHIEALREKSRTDERLKKLIHKIAKKHVSKFNASDDSKLLEQSENFIFEEYGVTLQLREEFEHLVIIQMLCSSERRAMLIDWLGKNKHFPMEVDNGIRLLTYYNENRHEFFRTKRTKNEPVEFNPLDKRVRSTDDFITFFRILANTDLNIELEKLVKNFEDFTPQVQRMICEQCSSFATVLVTLGMKPNLPDKMVNLSPR